MVYWTENISKCPDCKYKMKPTSRNATVYGLSEMAFKIYECPICRNSFIEYPGMEFAASADISIYYLSSAERQKVKLARQQNITNRHAAWEAKQERDRLERQRLEEQRQRENEARRLAEEKKREEELKREKAAEEERKRRALTEYTSDKLYISDKALFTRALNIIKQIYGEHAQFRPGQYEAIERTIKEKRLLVVQKTGWGKSLVYFVCTKLLRGEGAGVTLVISPLLALMENQLNQAKKMDLKCDVLNSTTSERRTEILQNMIDNSLDLVLATPESLNSKAVREALPSIRIGLVVIDEAHCISDWGHDFRLEYSKIYRVIEQLQKNVPVLATTATANNTVIKDLKRQMGEPGISRGHLMRANLFIQVLNLPEKETRYKTGDGSLSLVHSLSNKTKNCPLSYTGAKTRILTGRHSSIL